MENTTIKDLVITRTEKLRDGGTIVVMYKRFDTGGITEGELRIDKNGDLTPNQDLNITTSEETRELFKKALLKFFNKLQSDVHYEYQKVGIVSDMLRRTPLERPAYTDGNLVYEKCSDEKYRLLLPNGSLAPIGVTEKELQEHGFIQSRIK